MDQVLGAGDIPECLWEVITVLVSLSCVFIEDRYLVMDMNT